MGSSSQLLFMNSILRKRFYARWLSDAVLLTSVLSAAGIWWHVDSLLMSFLGVSVRQMQNISKCPQQSFTKGRHKVTSPVGMYCTLWITFKSHNDDSINRLEHTLRQNLLTLAWGLDYFILFIGDFDDRLHNEFSSLWMTPNLSVRSTCEVALVTQWIRNRMQVGRDKWLV